MKRVKGITIAIITILVVINNLSVQADIVSWWKMNEATSGSADGETIYDEKTTNNGTANDGANDSGMSWIEGTSAGALSFDGTDDYVNCGDSASLDVGTGDFTIEAWVKTSVSTGAMCIVGKRGLGGYGTVNGYIFSITNGCLKIYLDNDDGHYLSLVGGNVSDGCWHHVAVSVDRDNPSGIELYIDGVKSGTSADPTEVQNSFSNNIGFAIGRQGGTINSGYFNGFIDELIFYDNALSADEISQHYLGKVAEYLFAEGTGSSLEDFSGYENDGTLNGPQWENEWENGDIAGSLYFDGTDDYVACGDSLTLDIGTSDFTVEAWIKTSVSSGSLVIAGKRNIGGAGIRNGYVFSVYNGSLRIFFDNDDGGYLSLIGGSVSDGYWHHVVVSVDRDDSSGVKLYIDGTQTGTTANPTSVEKSLSNNIGLAIGRQGATISSGYFSGSIGKVAIYTRALSDNEISAIYCGDSGKPVSYWKFNESTGSTADDSEGNNDGTVYGANWVLGKNSNALDFDGTGDYVDCGNDDIYNFSETNAFTLACWIKPDSIEDLNQVIIGKYSGTYAGTPYQMQILTDGRLRVSIGNGTDYGLLYMPEHWNDIPSTYLTAGEWTHVAATYDGSILRGYVNGVEMASKRLDFILNNPASNLNIGRAANESGYFDGAIDEVRIYDRALSADEIKSVCQGLRGSWELNEGGSTKTFDASEYCNTGTLTNMDTMNCWIAGQLDPDGYFRNALQFDGINDYVDCGNDSSLDITREITISAWINPAAADEYGLIVSKGDYLAVDGYMFEFRGNNNILRLRNGRSLEWADSNAVFTEYNEWVHVAVTKDASDNVTFYKNGVAVGTDTLTLYSGTNNVIIGGEYPGCSGNSCFCGGIDKVRIYDRVLSADEIKKMQLLSAIPDHNYYTSESPIAVCSLDINSDSGLSGYSLIALDSQGNSLGSNSSIGKETDLTYSISSLPTGNNTISVELRNSSGNKMLSCNFDIVKRAVNTGNEVKIDQKNGIVLRNGSGFFPIGIYMGGVSSSDTAAFQEVSLAGFNSIIHLEYYLNPSAATDYLKTANDNTLLVVERVDNYSTVSLSSYKTSAEDFWDAYVDQSVRMTDAIDYSKQKSNLLAYYTFDEPYATQIAAGQDLYSRTNTKDGYHPTFAVYTATRLYNGDDYTNWSDIVGVDPYWIPPRVVDGDLITSIDYFVKYTYLACKRLKREKKVPWIVPMSEYWGNSSKRSILPEEQRAQTYLALIHGAKGIFFWRYPVYHEGSWENFKDLAKELKGLAPSVLTPDLEQTITYSTGIFYPENDKFTDVQVSLLKAPPGAGYDYILLAANTRRYPVDLDYTVSLLSNNDKVYRKVFEPTNGWERTIVNGIFSDQIEGFGTRAYTFSSASSDPITINVDLTARTDLEPSPESTFYQDTGRSGMTNIMQNPTLEDNTLSNWPEYCWPVSPYPWPVGRRINGQDPMWGLVTIQDSTRLPTGHGGKCLEIIKPDSGNRGFKFYLTPQHSVQNGKDYTFSMYMKADQNGRQVRFGCNLTGYVTKTLTTSWERYWCTWNFDPGLDVYDNCAFYINLLDENSTVWVDAIQVEATSQYDQNPPYDGIPVTFTTN